MSTQQEIPPLSEEEIRELDKLLQLMGGVVNTHELDCRCKDCALYVDIADELARRNKKHVGGCSTLQVKKGNAKLFKVSTCLIICLFLWPSGSGSKSALAQNSAPVNAPQMTSPYSSKPTNVNGAAKLQRSAGFRSSAGLLDACTLIDKLEIASLQGAPVQSLVPSNQSGGALAISQCYYAVVDASKNLSVHLQVIQAAQKGSRSNVVKNYWEKAFEEKDRGEEEAEKEASKPLPISGVGEEAFWVGTNVAGALYALKKGNLVRISVGGPDDAKTKIEKSKKLAAIVLKRLS